MTTLYHLTRSSNAESIAVSGILPYKDVQKGREDGFTADWCLREQPWRYDVVWLTQDPKSVVYQMSSSCWENDGVIIEVDVADIDTRLRDVYCNDAGTPIEYLVDAAIPVERIKSIKPWSEWKKDVHSTL